jgi:hypothetical protein
MLVGVCYSYQFQNTVISEKFFVPKECVDMGMYSDCKVVDLPGQAPDEVVREVTHAH